MEQENPGSFSLSLSVEPPNYFVKRIGDNVLLDAIIKPKYATWTINAIVPVELALDIQERISKQFDYVTDNAIMAGSKLEIEIENYMLTSSGAWIVSYTLGDYLFKGGLDYKLMQTITIVAKERKLRKKTVWNSTQ